jgi:glycerol transport system ATP-binding protein
VFNRPATLAAARAFSDPPLNVLPARFDGTRGIATLASGAANGLAQSLANGWTSGLEVALSPASVAAVRAAGVNEFLLALRPHQLHSEPGGCRSLALQGTVELAEISGSDTYLHVHTAGGDVVAQWRGIHPMALGSVAHLFLDPREFFGFTQEGTALFAPAAAVGDG